MDISSPKIQSQLLSEFQHDPNVLGVMVFGSQIHGTADACSDVDLYVLTRNIGKYSRQGFYIDGVLVDVLIDSFDEAKEYLQAENGAIRRPTSHMLASGKTIFERTKDLREFQKIAKKNLRSKTRSDKMSLLMHAYSLDDFFHELERDAQKNNHLQFAIDLQLFVNNAIEFVLRKHGTYWRRTDETIKILESCDSVFVEHLKRLYKDDLLIKRVNVLRDLFAYLAKEYDCVLPKKWKI